MIAVTPVIRCRCFGTRLWPVARADSPKQFSLSSGSRSLFQSAVHRGNAISATDCTVGDTLLITNEDHRFLALDQLKSLGFSAAFLLSEPVGRTTAPALTPAALHARQDGAETAYVVLGADSSRSHAVGKLVAKLHGQGRTKQLLHRKTHRPWGWYDNIDEGQGFKVMRIVVQWGTKRSLQRRRRRAEQRIVVEGLAEVNCCDKVFPLRENESTYISLGATQRLGNLGDSPLGIIEVQSRSYLDEDDIGRFDDVYGRITFAVVKAP